MPISRYEIRNEYSLADPELFRAADKDDPEALLEGVAMAGLVGVLRQLGDLAEFAAEIFHDLHEEMMATAARGHGLMIRVQQLEVEVPSIEKAFLSQTDHSSFFYNSGVDWHPNPRMDQNLVTKGDLPRFVMDSYEECRGPPRLFLLDKFDVAGAGACLKRYTDPSFFKVETSAMANADVQREKKFRKAKKKGPRGRYGETPELLPASHAKLHHLFLEEPDEKGVSRPSHRAKLKRRPNGFPFDSKTGKSYMENLLETPLPEHKILHGITASSPLWMSTNDQNESDLGVIELRSVSPARESGERKINPPPPDWEDTLNPFMNQTNGESTDIKICEVPSYPNTMTNGIPSTFDEESGEKDITVYGESKAEGSLTGYQSDDIASEIDNYMDAPSTIESEMDTDSELRVKNDFTSSYMKSQPSVSVKNGAHLHSQSSDSQSTGDLTISDEGSNSCKKEVSSFLSSASSRTSAEKPQSENLSAEGFPSADVPEIAIISASAYRKTPDEGFRVKGLLEPVVSSGTFSGRDALPINSPVFEQRASVFGSSNSIPILPHSEKKSNVIKYTPRIRSVSHSKSLSGDDSSSSEENLVDGKDAPCKSNIADSISHTADSPASASAFLLHEDDNDLEGPNQFGKTSTLNMGYVLSQNRNNAEEITSTESSTLGKLDDEVPKLPKNFAFDSTDIALNGDVIASKDPVAENQDDDLYDKDSNVVSDAPNGFSYIMEASIGKEFWETSLTNPKTASSKDYYSRSSVVNQIGTETSILAQLEETTDVQEAGHEAHDRDFLPEKAKVVNEIPELGTPKSLEVVGLQSTGITNDVTPNDLEDCAGTSDTAEKDGFSSGSGFTGLENSEISSNSDMKFLSEVCVQLFDSDPKTDQSETAPEACCIPAVSDNTIPEDVSLPARVRKLVEEHIPGFEDSGLGGELEQDETSFSENNRESGLVKANKNGHFGSREQSGLVEEMNAREEDTLHYHTVSCSTENNDQLESKSGVPYTVLNSYYESEVEHSLGSVGIAQLHMEQSGFDSTKSFQQSGVENLVSDANSPPIECASEETMLQEIIELPPDRIGQELPDSGEKNTELSSLLPFNHQKMLDQVDNEGHNNLASLPPHVSCQPLVLGLSGLSYHGSDVIAYPKDPSGFVFPPSNLFSQTNQVNLDELPPLPPLPPLQWRMGMLQHASSTTEVEKMEHKEESLQDISPPAASTSNFSSSLAHTNNPSIKISPQISLKEENVEQKSPNLEANPKHDLVDLPPKMENAQHQLVIPTQKNDDKEQHQLVIPSQKNDDREQHQLLMPTQKNDDGEQHQLVVPTQKNDDSEQLQLVMPPQENDDSRQHQLVIPSQKNDDGEQHQLVMPTQKNDDGEQHQLVMPTQKNDDEEQHQLLMLTEKNDGGEQHRLVMPTQKNDDSEQHQLVMPTQKNDDSEQHQLVMPTQKNDEGTSPAVEDGVAIGSRIVKLPRSCNPVIGSAAALDKSKLRKVTERDRPQIQKPDERDSLLEQIRAKSFNLKPAVASRHSVLGPNTNLKVAAILEKANAIRQALADSDEDDEDNWSDS